MSYCAGQLIRPEPEGRQNNEPKNNMKDQVILNVEELEERIAPSVNGTGGYDGQPGNQCSAKHNPSGSANPENSSSP